MKNLLLGRKDEKKDEVPAPTPAPDLKEAEETVYEKRRKEMERLCRLYGQPKCVGVVIDEEEFMRR